MRLFKNKRRAALSTAPGSYAEEDPSRVIFETSTKLKLEADRWMLISFGLAVIAVGAVWTRQPPPSVTRVVGVSADTGGHPIVTELVAYKPESQAVRTTVKDMAVRWFTIEPVLWDRLETSRMTANINSVKAQMIGAAAGQFRDWLKADTPFQQITANPKRGNHPLQELTDLGHDTVSISAPLLRCRSLRHGNQECAFTRLAV